MRSKESRYRTELYSRKGSNRFCVVEKVVKGILLTEFNSDGEVLVQLLNAGSDPEKALKEFTGTKELQVTDTDSYVPVRLNAECVACKCAEVVREMDLMQPSEIKETPVVPLYVCSSCRKKYYTMTDEYLHFLVGANLDLFDQNELGERTADEPLFIKTLQQYIIRIFAAKKISHIAIKR